MLEHLEPFVTYLQFLNRETEHMNDAPFHTRLMGISLVM